MSRHLTLDGLRTFLASLDKRFVMRKPGYGLSSNDFEDQFKEKLRGMQNLAERNIITAVSVNDEQVRIDADRVARIEITPIEEVKESEIEALFS